VTTLAGRQRSLLLVELFRTGARSRLVQAARGKAAPCRMRHRRSEAQSRADGAFQPVAMHRPVRGPVQSGGSALPRAICNPPATASFRRLPIGYLAGRC
jgi:hypothetical protein